MVAVHCSSPITLNTSDAFTCKCKGQGGNIPSNVTWYKGNVQIGGTRKEAQTLRLPNVDKDDSGIYRCEAKNHEQANNETRIELIVNCTYNCFMLFLELIVFKKFVLIMNYVFLQIHQKG
jgi:hypothetical protein